MVSKSFLFVAFLAAIAGAAPTQGKITIDLSIHPMAIIL